MSDIKPLDLHALVAGLEPVEAPLANKEPQRIRPWLLHNHEIEGEELDPLLNLYSPKSYSDALEACGWSTEEEIHILTEIARGNDPKATPAHKMAASAEIRRRGLENLKLAGRVGTTTLQGSAKSESGSQVTLTTRVHQLTKSDDAIAQLARPVGGYVLGENESLQEVTDGPTEADDPDDELGEGLSDEAIELLATDITNELLGEPEQSDQSAPGLPDSQPGDDPEAVPDGPAETWPPDQLCAGPGAQRDLEA